jgi:hypothetical protein
MTPSTRPWCSETSTRSQELDALLIEARSCRMCERFVPRGQRRMLQASATATILVVGQGLGAGMPQPSAQNTPCFQCNKWLGHDLLPTLHERITSIFAYGGSQ